MYLMIHTRPASMLDSSVTLAPVHQVILNTQHGPHGADLGKLTNAALSKWHHNTERHRPTWRTIQYTVHFEKPVRQVSPTHTACKQNTS